MIHKNTFHSKLQSHYVVQRTSGPLGPFYIPISKLTIVSKNSIQQSNLMVARGK